MAEKETKNNPKDLIEPTPEDLEKQDIVIEQVKEMTEEESRLDAWVPKTELGKEVKSGKEKSMENILKKRKKILEAEIVDFLVPNLETDLISIGQAKGKFGGGKRRAWRQTQKKTMEGNILTFSAMAVIGNKQGFVGIGTGKAKETLPAREKAIRQAKLNLIKVERGFENPNDRLKDEPHTVPLKVMGKCGSVRVELIPAPRGTGLVAGDQLKKLLRLAGIKDVYTTKKGQTRTNFNHVKACFDALRKLPSKQ